MRIMFIQKQSEIGVDLNLPFVISFDSGISDFSSHLEYSSSGVNLATLFITSSKVFVGRSIASFCFIIPIPSKIRTAAS